MRPGGGESDWTTSPARWFAVILLGTLTAAALAWSAVRGYGPPAATGTGRTAAIGVHTPAQALVGVSQKAPPPPVIRPAETAGKKIDINSATQAELELLPGIGPALAKRIIDHRSRHGSFRAVGQLDDVKGIGPKLLARLRDRVTVGPVPPAVGRGE